MSIEHPFMDAIIQKERMKIFPLLVLWKRIDLKTLFYFKVYVFEIVEFK